MDLERLGQPMKWFWRRRWWFVAAIVLALSSVVYLRLRSPRVQFVSFREVNRLRLAVFTLENPGSLTYGYNESQKATPHFQLKSPNGWEMKPMSGWVSYSGIIYPWGHLKLAPGQRAELLVPLICADQTPVTAPFLVGMEFWEPPSTWHNKLPASIQKLLPLWFGQASKRVSWSDVVTP